jgi:hypothetical protein
VDPDEFPLWVDGVKELTRKDRRNLGLQLNLESPGWLWNVNDLFGATVQYQ